jgi:serine protease Do
VSQVTGSFWTILIAISFLNGLSSCAKRSLPISVSNLNDNATPSIQTVSNLSPAERSVAQIARQVSVRIFAGKGSGSGVIIAHRGTIYTVLTNHHVVSDRPEKGYTILTPDGQTYPAQWLRSQKFGELDVALVQFNSTQSYQVVKMGKANELSIGDRVYAAGFPSWHFTKQGDTITSLENTRDWGLRAFNSTAGTVEMLSQPALEEGYQIGYTNDVVEGMSGGPVLSDRGELVGINGRLKYPLQGIKTFVFEDGTAPSKELFLQMEALSWAIPIARFQFSLITK